jgi:hypothetical protein
MNQKQRVLYTLKVGDGVEARVTERLANGDLIVSFDGDLLRVCNETRRQYRVGDTVSLIVRAINPLRFSSLPPAEETHRTGRLNRIG